MARSEATGGEVGSARRSVAWAGLRGGAVGRAEGAEGGEGGPKAEGQQAGPGEPRGAVPPQPAAPGAESGTPSAAPTVDARGEAEEGSHRERKARDGGLADAVMPPGTASIGTQVRRQPPAPPSPRHSTSTSGATWAP